MGANGILRIWPFWSFTNNANVKTARVRLGGIGGTQILNAVGANLGSIQQLQLLRNRNSQSSQVGIPAALGNLFNGTSGAPLTATVDTSVAQDLVFTGQLASGADTLTLESYLVEILYKA